MNTTELILDRMVYLPDSLRTEVLDFIEFLMNKYQITHTQEQDKTAEYEHLLALLLSKRSQNAQENPETVLSAEENRQLIRNKFNWHEQV